jgi:hypothetical protein
MAAPRLDTGPHQRSCENGVAGTSAVTGPQVFGFGEADRRPAAAASGRARFFIQSLNSLSILASFCQSRAFVTLLLVVRRHCCNLDARAKLTSVRLLPIEPALPYSPGAGGLPSCRIESPNRKLAPRQHSPFIPVHGGKLPGHVGKDGRELLRPRQGRLQRTL